MAMELRKAPDRVPRLGTDAPYSGYAGRIVERCRPYPFTREQTGNLLLGPPGPKIRKNALGKPVTELSAESRLRHGRARCKGNAPARSGRESPARPKLRPGNCSQQRADFIEIPQFKTLRSSSTQQPLHPPTILCGVCKLFNKDLMNRDGIGLEKLQELNRTIYQ